MQSSTLNLADIMDAQGVIAQLGLQPLPGEGGYFRETYRATATVADTVLPRAFHQQGDRQLATAIYYFLTIDTYSALHRLRADEMYHFYAGDPVALLTMDGSGNCAEVLLGSNFLVGHTPQFLVNAGHWQGSRLAPDGRWALMGTTVAPGFTFADCELATPKILLEYPQHAPRLRSLLPTVMDPID